jgi:hypothetical protein
MGSLPTVAGVGGEAGATKGSCIRISCPISARDLRNSESCGSSSWPGSDSAAQQWFCSCSFPWAKASAWRHAFGMPLASYSHCQQAPPVSQSVSHGPPLFVETFGTCCVWCCRYVRLELLEGVVAFHSGEQQQARQRLQSAQARWQKLQVCQQRVLDTLSLLSA